MDGQIITGGEEENFSGDCNLGNFQEVGGRFVAYQHLLLHDMFQNRNRTGVAGLKVEMSLALPGLAITFAPRAQLARFLFCYTAISIFM